MKRAAIHCTVGGIVGCSSPSIPSAVFPEESAGEFSPDALPCIFDSRQKSLCSIGSHLCTSTVRNTCPFFGKCAEWYVGVFNDQTKPARQCRGTLPSRSSVLSRHAYALFRPPAFVPCDWLSPVCGFQLPVEPLENERSSPGIVLGWRSSRIPETKQTIAPVALLGHSVQDRNHVVWYCCPSCRAGWSIRIRRAANNPFI